MSDEATEKYVAEMVARFKEQDRLVKKAVADHRSTSSLWMDRFRVIKEVCLIGTVALPPLAFVASLFFVGAWQLGLKGVVVPVFRNEFGIEADMTAQAEQREDLTRVLSETRDLAIRALGENRVIRQPSGLSYVTEPVKQGDELMLILVLERTATGAACRFVEGRAIFEDANGIPVTSEEPIRPQQQLGTAAKRLRVPIKPPPGLQPGRITVYLTLDYLCAGNLVPDRTDAIPYQLLPAS